MINFSITNFLLIICILLLTIVILLLNKAISKIKIKDILEEDKIEKFKEKEYINYINQNISELKATIESLQNTNIDFFNSIKNENNNSRDQRFFIHNLQNTIEKKNKHIKKLECTIARKDNKLKDLKNDTQT